MVLEKKLFEVVWICYFQTYELEETESRSLWQNYATDFFIFTILNTYILLIYHAKIQQQNI